jgi:hypothetical protein
MRKYKKIDIFKTLLTGLLVIWMLPIVVSARPLSRSAISFESSEDTELKDARRLNEEAQAEYYRLQTAKLKETPAPSASPTLLQSMAENSSLLILLGSILTTIVAVSSLLFSYRTTQKSQRDILFYDALRLLADKDNAQIRSSAAITLAQIGGRESMLESFPTRLPYLKPALDNLSTGLLLEQNHITARTIAEAINQLVPYAPRQVTDTLYQANLRLQNEMVEMLAEFFVAMGAKSFEDFVENGWHQASSVTTYDIKTLQDLVVHSPLDYSALIQRALQRYDLMNEEERRIYLMEASQALQVASTRLKLNIEVCSRAFKQSANVQFPLWRRLFSINWRRGCYHRIFLVEADLQRARLNRADLTDARLQYANLSNAQLKGAKLLGANMQGANLSNAALQGADLTGARLHKAILTGTKLKKANMLDAFLEDGSLSEAVM